MIIMRACKVVNLRRPAVKPNMNWMVHHGETAQLFRFISNFVGWENLGTRAMHNCMCTCNNFNQLYLLIECLRISLAAKNLSL